MKSEYWGAFPEKEIMLLEQAYEDRDLLKTIRVGYRGYHLHGTFGDNSETVDFMLENG